MHYGFWPGGHLPEQERKPNVIEQELELAADCAMLLIEIDRWLGKVTAFIVWDLAHGGDGRLH